MCVPECALVCVCEGERCASSRRGVSCPPGCAGSGTRRGRVCAGVRARVRASTCGYVSVSAWVCPCEWERQRRLSCGNPQLGSSRSESRARPYPAPVGRGDGGQGLGPCGVVPSRSREGSRSSPRPEGDLSWRGGDSLAGRPPAPVGERLWAPQGPAVTWVLKTRGRDACGKFERGAGSGRDEGEVRGRVRV